jgi:hypothetical protein
VFEQARSAEFDNFFATYDDRVMSPCTACAPPYLSRRDQRTPQQYSRNAC